MRVDMCRYVHVSAVTRGISALELELWMVVDQLTCILGSDLRISEKATNGLSLWTFSLALSSIF